MSAEALGGAPMELTELLEERRADAPEKADQLACLLGILPDVWLNSAADPTSKAVNKVPLVEHRIQGRRIDGSHGATANDQLANPSRLEALSRVDLLL